VTNGGPAGPSAIFDFPVFPANKGKGVISDGQPAEKTAIYRTFPVRIIVEKVL